MGDLEAKRKKTIICLLGFPGTGKSVVLKRLKKDLNLSPWHLGEYARSLGALSQTEQQVSALGGLLEGYNSRFLQAALSGVPDAVLLDGFPRSFEQANLLLQIRKEQGIRLAMINLHFPPGLEEKFSFQRQRDRAVHQNLEGEALRKEEERIQRKISRALEVDLQVIKYLRQEISDSLELDVRKGARPAYRIILPWIQELLRNE